MAIISAVEVWEAALVLQRQLAGLLALSGTEGTGEASKYAEAALSAAQQLLRMNGHGSRAYAEFELGRLSLLVPNGKPNAAADAFHSALQAAVHEKGEGVAAATAQLLWWAPHAWPPHWPRGPTFLLLRHPSAARGTACEAQLGYVSALFAQGGSSVHQVQSLLDSAARFLALTRQWEPTAYCQDLQEALDDQKKGLADLVAEYPGQRILPAVPVVSKVRGAPIPRYSCCGAVQLQLRKCSACKQVGAARGRAWLHAARGLQSSQLHHAPALFAGVLLLQGVPAEALEGGRPPGCVRRPCSGAPSHERQLSSRGKRQQLMRPFGSCSMFRIVYKPPLHACLQHACHGASDGARGARAKARRRLMAAVAAAALPSAFLDLTAIQSADRSHGIASPCNSATPAGRRRSGTPRPAALPARPR